MISELLYRDELPPVQAIRQPCLHCIPFSDVVLSLAAIVQWDWRSGCISAKRCFHGGEGHPGLYHSSNPIQSDEFLTLSKAFYETTPC